MTEWEGLHAAWVWGLDHGWTCVHGCVGGGVDTHALHLSQLTLRICLRGTSPPRPIHQPGPNTPCATVDTGLTTWHWQRWARPAAEWRPRQKERWIGLWSTFNLNYWKYFRLVGNWVHSEVYTEPDKCAWFSSVLYTETLIKTVCTQPASISETVQCSRSTNKQLCNFSWPCPYFRELRWA